MANDEQENEFACVVSNFLLNPEMQDEHTIHTFKNYFPSKYRSHDDINLLHESFVTKREMIKKAVRQHIKEFYKVKTTPKNTQEQNLKEVLNVLEVKQKQMNKELLKAKNELKGLEINITRCDKAVQDCHLMQAGSKKHFDMDLLKKLEMPNDQEEDRLSSKKRNNLHSL